MTTAEEVLAGRERSTDPGTVLIIGGTGGLGSAMVRRYAAAGDDVVLTYNLAADSAQRIADDATFEGGGKVEIAQLDLRDAGHLNEVVKLVEDRPLRSVIHSAASGVGRNLLDARSRHLEFTLDVNVRPLMTLLQKTVPLLAKREGSTFITCTSIGSRAVLPTYALVGVAKAAMESMVRYAAAEAGPKGVTVNALSTAPIPTKALSAFPVTDQWLNDSAKKTPLGRLLTPEEVADVAFFLTGPAARIITGQVIIVDGGWEILAPLSA